MDNNPVVFISQNKDIIIEFTKEKVNRNFSFAKSDSEDRYIYTLIFKNMVGTVVKEIKLSDCEMYILLDNIYYFIQSHSETLSVSLSCKESVGTSYIFIIETEYPEIQSINNFKSIVSKNIMKILQLNGETLIPILSFEVSNSIAEFANCIYDICIKDTDIEDNNSDISITNIGTLIKPHFLL